MSKWFSGRFRRGRGLVAAAAGALALTACDAPRFELPFELPFFTESQSDRAAGGGPGGGAGEQARATIRTPGQGRTAWRVGGDTARDVLGNLRISEVPAQPGFGRPIALAFANGVTAVAEMITVYDAEEASGMTGPSFASLLGASPDVDVFVYRVAEETVALSARSGGLCGDTPATHLGLAEYTDEDGASVLRILSFRGEAAPGDASGDAQLCASYRFVPQ